MITQEEYEEAQEIVWSYEYQLQRDKMESPEYCNK